MLSMKKLHYNKLSYLFCDNSCCYIKYITVYMIIINYSIVAGTRNNIMSSSGHISHHTGSNINSNNNINNNNNNIAAGLNDGNIQTNSALRRSSSSSSNNNNNNINTNNNNISYNNNNSNINVNSNNNNININNNNNNINNLLIGLSSCQTVCACKWKGGKQTVECIDRALITIPENIDPNTQVLDMSGNNLQILPHEQFVKANLLNLQKLYFRNCKIGQIDSDAFKGLTNLVELDLSHNLLTSVPSVTLQYVPSLRDITLASNPIQKIESYSFRNTPSLHKLDLSHCDIQTIAPQAFDGLDGLQSLKLNGNKLSELRPRTVETLSKLHGIELHDNPWMCDCRLRAAKIWLTEKNIPYPVAPICSGGPERVIDRTFSDLHVDDFACRPEMLPVNRYIESTMGDNATIICKASAIPSANVNWYWNGRLLANGSAFSSYQRVYIHEDGDREKRSRLTLTNSQETDSSEFYCVAENRAGTAEANFTLHVAMRTAGMASFGSGQIVGFSAALVILIVFILLLIFFLLIRIRRQPFIESKTPSHLEVITTVNQPGNINCKQQPPTSSSGSGLVTANGVIPNSIETNNFEGKTGNSGNDTKLANPVQKPPRLTDLSYTTSNYDNGGSVLSSASCFISPTASAGNNPDLINDTKRFGSDEFADLKIPTVLTTQITKDCLEQITTTIERPGSGEYSRAGGCDSLYPSGLWENNTTTSAVSHNFPNDDIYLKRATSTTISGFTNYNDKTPIIDNTQLYDLNSGTTNDYFSKTFPRTHFGTLSTAASSSSSGGGGINAAHSTTSTTTTALSSSIGGNSCGYPSDYGLPLVPGAEQQLQSHHHHHMNQQHHQHQQNQQFNNNVSCNNINNNNKNISNTVPTMLPNGMPINAKTIRVWQKGGVPVLPPVTALKRALTSSSRNSPDEGYQEGCGTDV